VRISFLVARRVPPVPSPVLIEVYRLLVRRGFHVEWGIPEEMVLRVDDLAPRHDLYVLKSHTELALSLAGVLDAQGARMLNPFSSCVGAQDKIVATRLLRAAGVPTPATWVTGDLALLQEVVDSRPLIAKPNRGHRGQGIHIFRNRHDLAAVPPPQSPLLIQDYLEGTGEDLKIYVVDRQVFGVRKPFSPDSFTRPGRPCAVPEDIRGIALRCGQALGLGLYGLDVIEGKDGPVVVDVNYFPGYKGIPGIAPVIGGYVERYAADPSDLDLHQIAPAPAGTAGVGS
jgi:ribosomal protein S6--L-glutamate ligase